MVRDDGRGAGDRCVGLGDALLDEISGYDKQDQVKRLERGELSSPDHTCYQEDEEEDDGGA